MNKETFSNSNNQSQNVRWEGISEWVNKEFHNFEGEKNLNSETGKIRDYSESDIYPKLQGETDEAYGARLKEMHEKGVEQESTERPSPLPEDISTSYSKWSRNLTEEQFADWQKRNEERAMRRLAEKRNLTEEQFADWQKRIKEKLAKQRLAGKPAQETVDDNPDNTERPNDDHLYEEWLKRRDRENQKNIIATGRRIVDSNGARWVVYDESKKPEQNQEQAPAQETVQKATQETAGKTTDSAVDKKADNPFARRVKEKVEPKPESNKRKEERKEIKEIDGQKIVINNNRIDGATLESEFERITGEKWPGNKYEVFWTNEERNSNGDLLSIYTIREQHYEEYGKSYGSDNARKKNTITATSEAAPNPRDDKEGDEKNVRAEIERLEKENSELRHELAELRAKIFDEYIQREKDLQEAAIEKLSKGTLLKMLVGKIIGDIVGKFKKWSKAKTISSDSNSQPTPSEPEQPAVPESDNLSGEEASEGAPGSSSEKEASEGSSGGLSEEGKSEETSKDAEKSEAERKADIKTVLKEIIIDGDVDDIVSHVFDGDKPFSDSEQEKFLQWVRSLSDNDRRAVGEYIKFQPGRFDMLKRILIVANYDREK